MREQVRDTVAYVLRKKLDRGLLPGGDKMKRDHWEGRFMLDRQEVRRRQVGKKDN
jgi:hypothetical protein